MSKKRITDKMRLDWLDQQMVMVHVLRPGIKAGWDFYWFDFNSPEGALRAAIDAAIRAESKARGKR